MKDFSIKGTSLKSILSELRKTMSFKKVVDNFQDLTLRDVQHGLSLIENEMEESSSTFDSGGTNGSVSIYFDGASKGNPGAAGVGVIFVNDDNDVLLQEKKAIGITTNNVAEYQALLLSLQKAAEYNFTDIQLFSDSELLVKQINREYKIKSPNLLELYKSAVALLKGFNSWTITHIYRTKNKSADRLANLALQS